MELPNAGCAPQDRIRLLVVAAIAFFAFATLYLGVGRPLVPALWVEVVAVATTLGGGLPVYVETYRALRLGRINMEASMALAIFASLAILQFTAAVVITFFVLLSEYIEAYALDRGRSTLVALERSAPKRALVRRNGREEEVDPTSLHIDDTVVVRQGERIPVDGQVTLGDASVNQAPITGESTAVDKHSGDSVYCGAVVEHGTIEVRTEKVGRETVFGKVLHLMEEAEGKRAPIQRISDRLAALLIEAAIGFSVVALLLTRNLTSTISVIVVAGACGVAAGTPLAIVATIGKAAKGGVVVKGGIYVEQMSQVDTVVIDKTGTLTLGESRVAAVVAFGGRSPSEVLETARRVEQYSTHPLARAILAKAQEAGLGQPLGPDSAVKGSATYLPGRGMFSGVGPQEVLVGNRMLMEDRGIRFPRTADPDPPLSGGGTVVFVARGGVAIGALQITDVIRAESRDAVTNLRKMGIRTVMLTGDNRGAADAVAESVGVDEVYSDLLPQDKVAIVARLVGEGRKVAMVGDGINDAPALARADVGIGMGAGTDVAIEEADVVLLTNDLPKIADTLRLSRKAYRTIWSNFFGTVSVDSLGVWLAVMGTLNPLSAAGIHVLSELIFIANSARLLR
jgi:heavy metal translocating P-type ATPase